RARLVVAANVVGQAAAHRISAEGSLRRAIVEVVVMAVPFGLAAALATTA
ncbi:copper resistance protein, partial [Rhodococcus wratislaviensis IFP 2016]